MDFIKDEKDFLKVSGWAFVKNQKPENYEITLLLKSKDETYQSATFAGLRPDVTAHFKSPYSLDDSGFSTIITKKELKKGKYQVGILIKNTLNSQQVIRWLDNFVVK